MDNQQGSPIPGFDGYTVTKSGDVFSVKRNKAIVKNVNGAGYLSVVLLNPGKSPKYLRRQVHGLVMATFVGDRPYGFVVNHMDGNKQNNRLENLEYVTASDNCRHAYETGLNNCVGETHHRSKLREKQVEAICDRLLNTKDSYSVIAADYNVSQSAINNIAGKRRWVRVSDRYWIGNLHRLGESRRVQEHSKRGTGKPEDIVRPHAKV